MATNVASFLSLWRSSLELSPDSRSEKVVKWLSVVKLELGVAWRLSAGQLASSEYKHRNLEQGIRDQKKFCVYLSGLKNNKVIPLLEPGGLEIIGRMGTHRVWTVNTGKSARRGNFRKTHCPVSVSSYNINIPYFFLLVGYLSRQVYVGNYAEFHRTGWQIRPLISITPPSYTLDFIYYHLILI